MTGRLILGAPDSPEQREFLGQRFSICMLLAGVELMLIGVVPHLAGDPHADEVNAVGLVALGVVCIPVSLSVVRLSLRFGPAMWMVVLPSAGVLGFLMAVLAGPSLAAFTVFVPVFGGGSHTFFSPRVAWGWTAAVAGCFALAIGLVGGPDALGIVLIGTVAGFGSGQLLKLVLERLVAASEAERSARDAADAARAELDVASARKSQFLARVSHELRTPLNAVLGFSGLVHERVAGPLSDKQDEYIDEVVASGHHLLALVDDVLHLSRVETGSEELVPSRLDLGALVERGVALFRDQAARKRIHLETTVPRGLVVEGDERKLRQVVFNLVSNAVKFTPDGGTVKVRLVASVDEIVLSVADTGPGIEQAQHALVFEPFRQASAESAAGSTGLGLAVARRFVELHRGSIHVESARGSGATFVVRIPTEVLQLEPSAPGTASGASDEDSLRAARARLITGIAAVLAVAGPVAFAAVVLAAPPASGGAWLPPVVAFGLLAAFAVWLARRPPELLGRPGPAHALVALSAATATVAVASAGSLGLAAAGGYALPTLAAVALLSTRGALVHGAMAAVALGVVVAVQPGFTTPVLRWQVVTAMSLLLGAIVAPLVEQVRELARSEASARIDAERDGLATQAATRHKSEFVATMSHELRTPLNAIIGFSEALREEVFGPVTALQAEYLDESLRAVRHLLALVNDVLELARLEAGRMPELQRTVRVDQVADVAVDTVAALDPPVRAELEVDGARLEVVGDDGVLTRCLVDLATWVADRAAGERTVRLAVIEHEGGVLVTASAPSAGRVDVSEAFDEFGGEPGRVRRATGLGMALARQQVHRHGGWCTAEATVGVVSVAAWLPAVATPQAMSRQEDDGAEGGRRGGEEQVRPGEGAATTPVA